MPPEGTTAAAPVAPAAPARDELDTAGQRERRKRIIDATLALARKGGYDAVQMRAVAKKADVALGTLYRYFPSKVHLLVAGLVSQFERAGERIGKATVPGDTAAERLMFVLERNTQALQRAPLLTEAMVRAFMFADATAAAEVERVGRLLEGMFAHALGVEDPTDEQRDTFHLIADVWMANLVAWVTHRASASEVQKRLGVAVKLLIKD
ncbi:Transcriptional regulator, TetR family OS=Tsukamurella paurometabola (strain ATCC 8368 / DSM/ CCUG 35730 / CIP 100753 / JCM 10117 / KCTC 9821 / NBRC 16120/ NCIMB 702349 / NCTC 13040) OX=521096 GN=Tpau_3788 PE=4 SV=1 [Tsukamurella paurometabola]|uniref:Transcriptional regulator, TetR family n=1 Tax=Tsukamurella paurometabola (strain ATCC 8368 / DSM 20162 / CCUG 35730 / CIP 100753 / JCM 10117 / KCTC 9821 / NBRC 16120 / NCIMB 702349 / NCTC 13040) TaxID=521096 RepID=D5UYR3_TSUPD|nr:cholesterol catabolism transcriptional regulator KstR [Tsukamurella paurometabola]ADG80366.1 transcriptional regulator, TetR family [Tsukamurella paurometabola DSM 20162]SUP39375.1 HTH-type transcriptional repressor KstR [Tsukamurella paurometabola]